MGRFWSIPLGRLCGIPIELHLTFLLVLAWVGYRSWNLGSWPTAVFYVTALLLFFGCIVLHELGHSLTARRYGIEVKRILLLPIGGLAQFERLPRRPGEELLVTAMGPAVNVLIAALLFLGLTLTGHAPWPFASLDATLRALPPANLGLEALALFLLFANTVMALFNLLPVFPMDGGRLLRALLAIRLPYLTATRAALWVAKPLAVAGMLAAVFISPSEPNWMLVALFAFIFIGGDLEYSFVRNQEAYRHRRIGDLTRRRFASLPPGATFAQALDLFAHENPPELLILDGPHVRAAYPRDEIAKRLAVAPLDAPILLRGDRPPPILQAEWPAEVFGDYLRRRPDSVFAVYSAGQLIGVVNAAETKQMLRWSGLRERNARP